MPYLNECFFIGHLTRNPERRVTTRGKNVARFGLAINRPTKDEAGNPVQHTEFIEVESWGKQGEICEKYLEVGSPIMLKARFKLEKWDAKDPGPGESVKRSRPVFVSIDIQFLNRSGKSADAPGSINGDESVED